ncbi:MAG: hypothetical protein DSY90_04310 [Deltaproteobacteria bacterium]|nr:MAG: hypothetical protein DSY90_04310 [Deltaproteobacteria bacterium]
MRMRNRDHTISRPDWFRIFLICAGIIFFSIPPSLARDDVFIGRFSSDIPGKKVPSQWEPLLFKSISRHTNYSLVKDAGQTVVKAVCHGSSSGLIRYIRIDPEKYPIIEWRWKISNIFKKGDVTRKAGDDYPARLYIAFEFNPENAGLIERAKYKTLKLFFGKTPPAGAINYIWASKAPDGTVVPSPYTGQSIMMVVQSGNAEVNRWITEKRDIIADYMTAFGKKPPMITAIAIMSDGNDTGESAVAYYGDIVMRGRDIGRERGPGGE